MSKTYYLHLKSGQNQATSNQTIEASGLTERPSVYVRNVAARVARQWGQGNGSKTVSYEVTDYAGNSLGVQTVAVSSPAPAVTLTLGDRTKLYAVLEALQQYIDNGEDADHLSDDPELRAKLEAASEFRDQLDAVLASLAE